MHLKDSKNMYKSWVKVCKIHDISCSKNHPRTRIQLVKYPVLAASLRCLKPRIPTLICEFNYSRHELMNKFDMFTNFIKRTLVVFVNLAQQY